MFFLPEKKRIYQNQRRIFGNGFLLLDISLAVLLIFLALLPLQAVFYYSQLHLSAARLLTGAVMLAQAGLEESLDASYDSLVSRDRASVPGQPGYSRSISVADSPNGRWKTIVVTVYYPGADGEKQVSLAVQRANPHIRLSSTGQ